MTTFDEQTTHLPIVSASDGSPSQAQQLEQRLERARKHPINVSEDERTVSVAAGTILALMGLSRRSLPGLLIAAVGGGLLHRGITGHCRISQLCGCDSAHLTEAPDRERSIRARGIHIEQAFLINRSPQDLYQFWRNFENLPGIMTHLKSVTVIDDRRSHWVADAPRLVGGSVEWDAEITQDQQNERIVWQSLPGSSVNSVGEIRFTPAMGDRGTEVHVTMDYIPPAGTLGHAVATMFLSHPRRQMRDDLRRFKQLMETGEIPTIKHQPTGTCTGKGTHAMTEV
jgi:uncharacterized membrane protein